MNKESESNFFLTFPPNKHTGDISPYKIFVVILLKEYLRKKKAQDESGEEKPKQLDDFFSVDEKSEIPSNNYIPEYRRRFSILLLKLIQISDMTYREFHSLISTGKHRIDNKHLKRFEKSIEVLSEYGIEVLFKLSKIMDELITDTHTKTNSPIIHQSSCVGLFFRRILIYLDKMSFQELMELHQSITIYYEKGIRAIGISNKACTIEEIEASTVIKQKWSSKQAEIFISQQSALLENDEVKALNPKELQKKIDDIVQTYQPLSSKAYFLSYLNNVRIRDLPNCLEALHRSFDKNVGKQSGENSDTPNKTHFQYSLLNLAILHTIFEQNGEALKCLKECIMIAQETGDRVCLQLAQLWLCLLDKKNFQLSEKNIANKTEKVLVRSVSLNIQSLVKVAAISGYLPSKLFDVLVKSDILNCQHSIMNLIANCIAERAALWTIYGKHEMASLISQQLLNSNLKVMEKSHNGEGLCLALCSVALWLSFQGESTTSSTLILSRLKQRFPRHPLSKNWMTVEYYILSIQAIHLEKWSDGIEACDNLYHIDKNLSIMQRATLNLARGNRSTALNLVDLLLEQEDDKIDSLYRIRAMTVQVGDSFQIYI
jgi:anaphase-promoting complex subunit 5